MSWECQQPVSPVGTVSVSCLAAQPQGGVGDTGQVEVVQAQGLNCQEKGKYKAASVFTAVLHLNTGQPSEAS